MIHGELKGVRFCTVIIFQNFSSVAPKADIMINNYGHACLADFGSLMITSDEPNVTSSTPSGGAVRWTSPELLDPDGFGLVDSCPTKESDCYAMGMVMYEVLSEQVPFYLSREFVAMQKIIEGSRPEKPKGEMGILFKDGIWELVQHCWAHLPCDRMSAKDVLLGLERISSPLRPSPDVDGILRTNATQRGDTENYSGMFLHSSVLAVILMMCHSSAD